MVSVSGDAPHDPMLSVSARESEAEDAPED